MTFTLVLSMRREIAVYVKRSPGLSIFLLSPVPMSVGHSVLRAVIDGRFNLSSRPLDALRSRGIEIKCEPFDHDSRSRLYFDLPVGVLGRSLPSTARAFKHLVGGDVATYYTVCVWMFQRVEYVHGSNYQQMVQGVCALADSLNRDRSVGDLVAV